MALDLDGTLIGHDLTIHERSRDAVARAMELGVHVTLATGRMYQATLPYATTLRITDPLICYQGAYIRTPGDPQPLLHRTVPLKYAQQVIDISRERGIHLNVYLDDRFYVEKITDEARLYERISGVPAVLVPDLKRFTRRRPTKLVLITTAEQSTPLVRELQALFGDGVYVTKSYPLFVEITHPSVSKGRALQRLAQRLGIPRSQVMAIGDNMNDADMVAWAGLGVAVGGATPEVLAAANYVAPPVTEEGAAEAIERFVLDGRANMLTHLLEETDRS